MLMAAGVASSTKKVQNIIHKEEFGMDIERRIVAIALAIVALNYFFLASSANHVKIGWIWLVVDVILWLPELKKLGSKL